MHVRHPAFAAIPGVLAVMAGSATAQVRLALQATPFSGGASTVIAQPPGETRRLYQAVRAGSVRMVRDNAAVTQPVLTLSNVSSAGEDGLLGLAFHPQFQQNGFMYVYYSTTVAPAGDRLERYTLDPVNPDAVIPGSAQTVLTVSRSSGVHHGGWLGFGPDGYLYLSVGNTGNSANSQSMTVLLGKLLRLDVDHDDFPADPLRNYAVPLTNPFAGSASIANEIWATGLRNPWRCSFDRLTGDLWIGDVGDSSLEEIDFQPAIGPPPYTARNYGYACLEGSICKNSGCPCYDGTMTLPIHEYGRTYGYSTLCGYVYRGSAIPALRGAFVGADYSGNTYSFRKSGLSIVEYRRLTSQLSAGALYAMGEDQAGELYLCTSFGPVYRIAPACPANCDGSTATPALNVADFTCFLQAFAASDPYANCDGSTAQPTLNIADFTCFLQSFAAGVGTGGCQ